MNFDPTPEENVDPSVLRLLFVHRDPALAERARTLLAPTPGMPEGPEYRVAHFTHLFDALTYLKISPVDLIVVGPRPADIEILAAIREMGAAHPEIPSVALMTSPDADEVHEARLAGAREVLPADEVVDDQAVVVKWKGRNVKRRPKRSVEVLLVDWVERLDPGFLPVAEIRL